MDYFTRLSHEEEWNKYEKQKKILSQLIGVLPFEERRITYLKYTKGYAVAEIAKEMNISPVIIKNRLSSALMKMRAGLNDNYFYRNGISFHNNKLSGSTPDIYSSERKNAYVAIELNEINEALITYLSKHPHRMYDLDPRKFEELVAELLKDMGYEVHLTDFAKDGGRDILAVMTVPPNMKILTIVECKRYHPGNPVGIEIVERFMYTIREFDKANAGLIATTSFFTEGARCIEEKYKWLLKLEDFSHMQGWLSNYGQWGRSSASSGLWLPDKPVA